MRHTQLSAFPVYAQSHCLRRPTKLHHLQTADTQTPTLQIQILPKNTKNSTGDGGEASVESNTLEGWAWLVMENVNGALTVQTGEEWLLIRSLVILISEIVHGHGKTSHTNETKRHFLTTKVILTLSSRSSGPVSCLLRLSGVCPPSDWCTSGHSVTSLENVSQWMQLYTVHLWLQALENRFLWWARWTVTYYFLESVDAYHFSLEHAGFVPSGSPPSLPHIPFQTGVICLVYM